MSTVPNPSHDRTYPMPAPADDRRFTLGLVFDVAQVLVDHGFAPITAGGDLVALQQALYGFLYRAPDAVTEVADGHVVHHCCGRIDDAAHKNFCEHYRAPDDGGFAERFLERQQDARRAALLADEQGREGYAEGYVDCVVATRPERAERAELLADEELANEDAR